ncbi:hypothetical protein MbovBow_01310 [Mycoplasmopsis bovis]
MNIWSLGQLVGFTDEESDTELFLFPTDLNNEVKLTLGMPIDEHICNTINSFNH